MTNKRVGCMAVFAFILLCLGVFFLFILVGIFGRGSGNILASHPPEFEEEMVVKGTKTTPGATEKIALIYLRGMISSAINGALGESMVDDIKIALGQAIDDDDVKAIVLYVDSPGGEVTASDMIYNAVIRAREKKPVVVYMGSMAASGGYYVACGGTWLMASDTTITGSIGVIIQTLNYQQLFGKLGLESVVFKSGKFKDTLSGSRPMTPEEKEYIQGLVMQTYGKFVGIVAEERKLPLDELQTGIADGRVISGRDALQEKLVNQLGQIEDAFEKAKELGKAPGAAVIRYAPPFQLGKIFRMLAKSDSKLEISLPQQLTPSLEPGRIYLLPGFYTP